VPYSANHKFPYIFGYLLTRGLAAVVVSNNLSAKHPINAAQTLHNVVGLATETVHPQRRVHTLLSANDF
jgi:hypothetical protein